MIASLTLRDFRSHQHTSLNLDRVSWFVGPNNSGKSSIAAAMEFALTGADEFDDTATQVRHGAKGASVSLRVEDERVTGPGEIEYGWEVERCIPSAKGVTTLNAVIEERFGVPLKQMALLLRTRRFFDLPEKEQRAALDALFGESLTGEEWILALNLWTPEFPDLGDDFRGEWPKVQHAKSPHAYFYDKRTAENRTLADLKKRLQVAQDTPKPAGYDPGTVPSLRAQLESVRKRLTEMRTQAEGAEREHAGKVQAYQADVRTFDTLKREVERLQAEAQQVTEKALAVNKKTHRPLDEIHEAIAQFEESLTLERAQQDTAAAEASKWSAGDGCPEGTCGRREMANATSRLNDTILQVRRYEEKLQTLRQELAEAKTISESQAMWSASHTEVYARLAAAQQRLQEVGPKPEQPAAPDLANLAKTVLAIQHEGDALQQRLVQAEAVQRQAAAYEQAQAEVERLKTEVETQEKVVARVEALVTACDPAKGIPYKHNEERIRTVWVEASILANRYFNMGLCVKDGSVRGRAAAVAKSETDTSYQVWLPINQLCWSERGRASACFQVACARAIGFPLVVIDEHALDPSLRGNLLEMLLAQDDLQSIVLSTAVECDEGGAFLLPEAPDVDGLAVFWVEAGTVRRVEPALEAVA